MGHSSKAIRTVGVREQILFEKTKEFGCQGILRPLGADKNSDWVSRAFLVPKPNGKWRVVIDYRYQQKSFAQTGKAQRWIDLLPLALWCADDLPGPISGISPHRLVF